MLIHKPKYSIHVFIEKKKSKIIYWSWKEKHLQSYLFHLEKQRLAYAPKEPKLSGTILNKRISKREFEQLSKSVTEILEITPTVHMKIEPESIGVVERLKYLVSL
jgi:hypothetical protein